MVNKYKPNFWENTPWKTQNSEGCAILITLKNETSQLLWVIYGWNLLKKKCPLPAIKRKAVCAIKSRIFLFVSATLLSWFLASFLNKYLICPTNPVYLIHLDTCNFVAFDICKIVVLYMICISYLWHRNRTSVIIKAMHEKTRRNEVIPFKAENRK